MWFSSGLQIQQTWLWMVHTCAKYIIYASNVTPDRNSLFDSGLGRNNGPISVFFFFPALRLVRAHCEKSEMAKLD